LRASSAACRQPVDPEFARRVLSELAPVGRRQIQLADIERAVCETFGVSGSMLKCEHRGKRHSQPRMLAMWLARRHTRSALSEICDYFGRKSHATVISAEKRVERWRAEGTALELAENLWQAEDAIRQVEARLKRA